MVLQELMAHLDRMDPTALLGQTELRVQMDHLERRATRGIMVSMDLQELRVNQVKRASREKRAIQEVHLVL
tara:strand:+ start:330 stop:542 length:213 start_codon:yes stop_codon:yes gene_type:complete